YIITNLEERKNNERLTNKPRRLCPTSKNCSLNLTHCCQANTFGYSRGRQILECDCGGENRKRLAGSYFPEDTGSSLSSQACTMNLSKVRTVCYFENHEADRLLNV
ncbi:hypothetical protein Prudu_019429, partial [Prunus dulcis]